MRNKLVTNLATIAREAGVSASTVSRVLNNCGRVSAGTRQRILEIIHSRKLLYRSNCRTILVILPGTEEDLAWYSVKLLSNLRRESRRRNFHLELVSHDDLSVIAERNFFGVISFDFRHGISAVWGKDSALPLVCLNDAGSLLEKVPAIYSDEAAGLSLAVDHLAGYNHRRIGLLLEGADTFSASGRESAFFASMAKWNLADTAVVARQISEPFGPVATLLQAGVTAIIAPTESMSIWVLHALRSLGLRIPEDLSLVTWELSYISEFQDPPLTTLEQNFGVIASRAFETLEKMFYGQNVPLEQRIEYKLNKRNSVALPPR